ncbi:MAG: polysulfide reductase NrfD [Deltaproteobacteria bacterium]|nr:polysulfide reductase NrfD [Deltaproteobacteria bacterium]
MTEKTYKILIGLVTLGLLVGAWGIIEALIWGTHAPGLTSYSPWGMGVVIYLYLLGLSAGGFLLTIMTHIFGLKRYEPLAGLAACLVLVTEICAIISITLDLGHWERIYLLLIRPNLGTPMTWMIILFNAMVLIYLLKIFFFIKKDERWINTLSYVSLPVALFFYGVNGAFFSILSSRPVWNTPLTPLTFIVASLLSGGALLTLLTQVYQPERNLTSGLGRAVLLLLVIYSILEGLQYYVGYQGAVVDVTKALNDVTSGQGWWRFWIIHLLLGTLVPLYLLCTQGGNPKAVAWACLMIVITFTAVRYDFLISAQTVPMLSGLDKAFVHQRLSLTYCAHFGEWLIGLFLVSLGGLAFLLGQRLVPTLFFSKGGTHA